MKKSLSSIWLLMLSIDKKKSALVDTCLPPTPQKYYEQSSYDLFITNLLISRVCLNALSLVVGKEDMDEYFAICFSPLQQAW